jgi:ferritin-like protein
VEYKDNGVPNSVGDLQNLVKVSVTPNPVTDRAYFDLSALEAGNHTLTLFDANGRAVLREEVTHSSATLYLDNLHPGTYHYRISNAANKVVSTGSLIRI